MAFRIIFLATGTPLYGPRLFFSEMIRPIDRANFTYRWLRGFFVCTISRFSFPRMLLVPKKMRSIVYVSRPKKRLPPAPEPRRVNPKHRREPNSHAYFGCISYRLATVALPAGLQPSRIHASNVSRSHRTRAPIFTDRGILPASVNRYTVLFEHASNLATATTSSNATSPGRLVVVFAFGRGSFFCWLAASRHCLK